MTNLEELEKTIDALPEEAYRQFRLWFLERDWERWDRQIGDDSRAGKLNFLMGADLLRRRSWQRSSLKRPAHSDRNGYVGAPGSYGISSRHQNPHWSAASGFE
jgi:hypothetical protein